MGLRLGLLDCGIGFFNHCRIVLGHFVQHPHGNRNFLNCRRLIAACARDGLHGLSIAADRRQHIQQLLGGTGNEATAPLHFVDRLFDQAFDFSRSTRRRLRQSPHFDRNHRKALTRIPGPRRFHRSVQRQQIGLEGDVINHPNDVGNLGRAGGNPLHCRIGLAHGGAGCRTFARDNLGSVTGIRR